MVDAGGVMVKFDYQGKTVYFPPTGKMYTSHFKKGHFYEHDFLEYIASLNLVGTYLDVGCNLGNHLLFFAKYTKAERTIAFEPIERFQLNIQKVIEINNISDQVSLLPVAASDHDFRGILTFNSVDYEVKYITIDSLNLEDVALIKIDVEGMEKNVLIGSLDTIDRCKPVIFAEAHSDSQKRELDDILSRVGYKPSGNIFNATPTHEYLPTEM